MTLPNDNGLWAPNTESVIKYDSNYLSGNSFSSSIGGIKFTAEVQVQGFMDNTLRVKMNHVRFHRNNYEVSQMETRQILEDLSRKLRGGIPGIQEFKTFTEGPFQIQLKNNKAKTIITSRSEPLLVTEIKKNLALQLEQNISDSNLQLVKKVAISSAIAIPSSPKMVKVIFVNFSICGLNGMPDLDLY